MSTVTGRPVDRADGRQKVTGAARYAADYPVEGVTWGIPLLSTIGSGRIVSIDTEAAGRLPGVVTIITRDNATKLHHPHIDFNTATKPGEKRILFEDDVIYYGGQYIGLVVAESEEVAREAARRVVVEYVENRPLLAIDKSNCYDPEQFFGQPLQYQRGDTEAALKSASFVVRQSYTTPIEHHHPMEPSATTAVWNGDELTLYDATQWVVGARNVVAQTLGIAPEQIHIVSPFVGGGFGSKGFIWGHTVLAAMAARMVGRPVKLVLSRRDMFSATGHRAETLQELALGADETGHLTAVRHHTWVQTSPVEEFIEQCGVTAKFLYRCPNVDVAHHATRVNIATPAPMRAPGESPGLFAYESALDELAYMMRLDPLEIRIRNASERDEYKNLPWSSNHLPACYRLAAERFGWSRRPLEPRTMRHGQSLIGWGMGTATYPAMKAPGAAIARLDADGQVQIFSATQDLGTGTYTTMAQLTSDVLQVPMARVHMQLGDSRLPAAPVSGGSMTTASVGPAVQGAAQGLLQKLIELAVADGPLGGQPADQVRAVAEGLAVGASRESYVDLLRRKGLESVEATSEIFPGAEMGQYSFHSFGCTMVEVRVDPDFGEVRVSRIVAAYDVGRVLNGKTSRSQLIGGIIQGLGMALMEHTVYEPRHGRVVSNSLADYLIPVNADVPGDIDILFVNEPDPHINVLGARGLGEIGITGVAGAVANAVWHATGRRICSLPISPEKLLQESV